MEPKQYLELLKRWAWLLILGLIVGVAGGYIFSLNQPAVYEASTKIMVIRAPQSNGADLTAVNDQQLVQTYIQLLGTRSVIEAVSDQLKYPVSNEQIKVQQVNGTQIIQITVEDGQAQRAAEIANTLVQVLVEHSDTLQSGRFATSESSIQAQITQVETQISSLQSQIDKISAQTVEDQLKQVQSEISTLQPEVSKLQQEIAILTKKGTPTDPAQLAQLADDQARLNQLQPLLTLYQQIYTNLVVLGQPSNSTDSTGNDKRVSQLQTTLGLYQQIYMNLLNNLETIRLARLQTTPNVVQIDAAIVSNSPVRPKPVTNAILTGMVGLILAAAIAFLIEYLDNTLKSASDVEGLMGLSVIGYIAQMDVKKKEYAVYVSKQPRSLVAEAFRALRTNLEFSGVSRELKTILVTSSTPGEGKTTIAVNLAAILAQGGKRVVLLDADLRRPQVHRFLGIPNRVGLTDVFREQVILQKALHKWDGAEGVLVLTSGSIPPNPAELLGSEKMEYILRELTTLADYVVIDSPPTIITDAQVLASQVDGIILVIQPGKTQADVAMAALEQMKRVDGKVIGVVMNRIPRNRSHYYGGYRYYSPYYHARSENASGMEEKSVIYNVKKRNGIGQLLNQLEPVQEQEPGQSANEQ
jgi:capsular exopolysaccharide synthesis family protein